MEYSMYSNDVDVYALPNGCHLVRADNEPFVRAWVVYRGVNEDFAQTFEERMADLAGVPFCFWVVWAERRVAGVVLLPNNIGDFFLIPPEKEARVLLTAVFTLLERWSNPEKRIVAQAIAHAYVPIFEKHGFVTQESRVFMIRPTSVESVTWEDAWEIRPFAIEEADAVADLLLAAFAGGVGEYGRRDKAAHLASVQDFCQKFVSDSACGQASALLFDRDGGALTAVCMVDMHKGLPTLRFVAVHPKSQRHGLATRLIRQAIGVLSAEFGWVKLAVTVGNPALGLYERLGFAAGDRLYQLVK